MSNINMVIVPVWLNLIQKELGIADADFANYEKISGILSPRDLLIYKIANFQVEDILGWIGGYQNAGKVHFDFGSVVPKPALEELASMANVSVQTLAIGVTSANDEMPYVSVELADTELLVVRLYPARNAPDSVKQREGCIATKITKALHGRIDLKDLANTVAFRRYVDNVQNNSVFY